MPKVDDTNVVPEELNAPWIKRFFKNKFGIPVRVKAGRGKGKWLSIWIMCDQSVDHRQPMVYHHHFSAELGNRCMKLVYSDSEVLSKQAWGGNIQSHSISMHVDEFRQLFNDLIADLTQETS